MKRIALLVLVSAVLGAAYWVTRSHMTKSQDAAVVPTVVAVGREVVSIPVDSPRLSYIQTMMTSEQPLPVTDPLAARIALDETVTARVYTPLAGRVLSLNAELGDRVVKGAALAVLDSPDFGGVMSDLSKAELMAARAEKQLARAKLLFEGEVLSRRDYEAAVAEAGAAQAEVDRTRLRVGNVVPAGNKVEGERFVLRAPMSGIVADRQVNPGTEVQPASTHPLFVVSDLSRLWLLIDLPEKDLAHLHLGQSVLVRADAWPESRFTATVERISPLMDPATRRVQVRCRLPNDKGQLRPEMFARAFVVDDQKTGTVRLPLSAVLSEGLYSAVFVETKPGEFVRRRVTLVRQDSEAVYLKPGREGGVLPGEKVVIKGALLLNSELASGG